MGHTAPDWGDDAPKSTVYSDIDLAELAVRLGSIVTHDRRGDVIWLEDFASGIGSLKTGGTHSTRSMKWSSLYSKSRGFSCELITPPSSGYCVFLTHTLPLPVLGKIGAEFSFSFEGGIKPIESSFSIYIGTEWHRPRVRWNTVSETWQYRDANNAYQSLSPAQTLHHDFEQFHVVKLVVDLINENYVRLICNDVEFDMSGLPYYKITASRDISLQHSVLATSENAEQVACYVDDIIFTQNEP